MEIDPVAEVLGHGAMWIGKRRTWIATVTLGGFVLPSFWLRTLLVTGLSVVTTVVFRHFPALHYSITPVPFTLIGLPLGIFLGFRNNTAYDRFWEGRRLWGSLVNTARTLARQWLVLLDVPAAEGSHPVAPDDSIRERLHP